MGHDVVIAPSRVRGAKPRSHQLRGHHRAHRYGQRAVAVLLDAHPVEQRRVEVETLDLRVVQKRQPLPDGLDQDLVVQCHLVHRLVVEVHDHVLRSSVMSDDGPRLPLRVSGYQLRGIPRTREHIESRVRPGLALLVVHDARYARLHVIARPSERGVPDLHVVRDPSRTRKRERLTVRAH